MYSEYFLNKGFRCYISQSTTLQESGRINEYLNWRDIPETREPKPRNPFLTTVLSIGSKRVSHLYRQILPKGNQIIGESTDKWLKKTELEFSSFDLQKSSHLHHTSLKDCYLKYTQFRTLHRFFTNDKLFKMGIKPSDKCTFCKETTEMALLDYLL